MLSPTGNGVRGFDDFGSGFYGVSRDGGKRYHKGADFICTPGQEVVAPAKGIIRRVKLPYANPVEGVLFSGVLIHGHNYMITMFYLEPIMRLITMSVEMGQVIGHAQDISLKYPGMIPHIHLEFDSINPELFINLP